MREAVKSILWSQLCLYAGLALCIALKPAGLGANRGISYYGIYGETFVPYAAGLLGATYFMLRAHDLTPLGEVRLALKAYTPLIVGIVITPVTAGRWIDYLHTTFGTILFLLQLVLSGWLIWRLRYIWWSVSLGLIELLGGVISAVYVAPPQGFLMQGQVLFQLAFGALLSLGLQQLGPTEPRLKAAHTPVHEHPYS